MHPCSCFVQIQAGGASSFDLDGVNGCSAILKVGGYGKVAVG